jgi:hypothetical protein
MPREVTTKCGFCSEVGHKINTCFHPNASMLFREMRAIVNGLASLNGHPDPAFDWFKARSAVEIKLLASRLNLPVSVPRTTSISNLMDFHYPDYANPVWRELLPSEELLVARSRAAVYRNNINHLIIRLNVPIDLTPRQVGRMNLADLEQLNDALIEVDQAQRRERRYGNYNYANNPHNVERKFAIAIALSSHQEEDNKLKKEEECPICYECVTPDNMVELNCAHEFCGDCLSTLLKTTARNKEPTCSLCRGDMLTFKTHSKEVHDNIRPMLA